MSRTAHVLVRTSIESEEPTEKATEKDGDFYKHR